MKERIRTLREQSLNAPESISCERAVLITEYYRSPEAQADSIPVLRAKAFSHLLANKSLYVGDGELIVGERGPKPKAVPTYPEVCVHTPEDLEILNSRPLTKYLVDDETRKVYANGMGTYWKGKAVRDRIMASMSAEWLDAYEAGVYTEFMEQRAPGHTVCGSRIFKEGLSGYKKRIADAIAKLDFQNDPEAFGKWEELQAMAIAADAVISFARRYADNLASMAAEESEPARKKELETMAENCRRVPENPPRSFWEALQFYWFLHVAVVSELNTWDSFNPGRLDQHLWPFYNQETHDGSLTEEWAKELLQAFWVKFNNHPAPPKIGVTAAESGTYTDFCLINLGGVKEDGGDAVNDLTYLILEVIEEMRLLQPSSMVQVSKKNPDRYVRRALQIIKTGFGQPSVFNTDAIVQELVRQGKSVEDARCGGASGCVESGAFGKEAYILTGYFNLTKIFELALHNGFDPRTQKQVGLRTGDPTTFQTFDELFDAFAKQVCYFVDVKIGGNNIIDRIYAKYLPTPMLSLLTDDCIINGRDYHDGGARYNTSYIQGVGMGSLTDSLASIKHHVFDHKTMTMQQLRRVLAKNFEGEEEIRQMFLNDTPKYGNDDDYADDISRRIFEVFFDAVDGRPTAKGGQHRINLLPTTVHVYFGSVIGALPEGRKAGEPISEGISPVQGSDRRGPTSVLKSAAKLDHIRTGGTLLNQRFSPRLMEDEKGIEGVKNLIRAYFRMDGHHIQFNVFSTDTLRDAQKHPERYRDLIVRVAGYSDYFVDLNEGLQEEIIRRTEHAAF